MNQHNPTSIANQLGHQCSEEHGDLSAGKIRAAQLAPPFVTQRKWLLAGVDTLQALAVTRAEAVQDVPVLFPLTHLRSAWPTGLCDPNWINPAPKPPNI